MPYPQQTFSTITDLLAYINSEVVTNGNQEITAIVENNVENSLANFIVKYTLNSGLTAISSITGVISLVKPVTVFTVVPTSISLGNNVQNEYYIVNATGLSIPLTTGNSYTDAYQVSQTSIPPRTSIHIAKAINGSWVQINNIGGGGNGGLPPQTGNQGKFLTTNGTSASWGDLNIPGGPISTLPTVGYNPGTNVSVQDWIISVFYRLAISVQPQSQNITEGNGVTFTVTAIGGTAPYTYQWKKNGVDIPFATNSSYNIPATTTGSAGNYTVVIADAIANIITSNAATLTITGSTTVQYGRSATDPYVDNGTVPVYGTVRNQAHVPNTNISIPFDSADANNYLVLRTAAAESTKTAYFNTVLNNGSIPDIAWRAPFIVGIYEYYVSRNPFALDAASPTIFS